MSLQPIVAATCMACTIPFNNSSSPYEKEEEIESNQDKMYKKENNVYVVHATNTESISPRVLNYTNHSYYDPPPPSNRYYMKVSMKNRKNHNIHQPGRTNCTQRYQK
jgi:hypothetical protein